MFANVVIAAIIVAGVTVGLESYPHFDGNRAVSSTELAVQVIFTIECLLKIAQEGPRPQQYW